MQPAGRELKTITVSNIDMELRGFRYRCTDTNKLDRWLTIREIQYNMSDKTQQPVEYYKGTLIRTDEWSVYQGEENSVTDGDDSTFLSGTIQAMKTHPWRGTISDWISEKYEKSVSSTSF